MASEPKNKTKLEEYGYVYDRFNLVYEDRLVAFLDILGFSKMIMGRQDQDVELVVNIIPDELRVHKAHVLRKDLEVTNISDSIIISMKAEPDAVLKDLFNLSVIIGRVQHQLAVSGYFMRGGISVGKALHDAERNRILGPAYIEAYLLERDKSIVPRVIFGNEIKAFYGVTNAQIIAALNGEFAQFYYQGTLVKETPAGHPLAVNECDLFVDYVSSIVGRDQNGFKGVTKGYLKQLLAALGRGEALEKYQWLAKYTFESVEPYKYLLDEEAIDCLADIERLSRVKGA